MTETARREGILALQEWVEQIDEDLMKNVLQLALKGTSPDLIRDQHHSRVTALLKYQDMRYRMIIYFVTILSAYHGHSQKRRRLEPFVDRGSARQWVSHDQRRQDAQLSLSHTLGF